jgi:hypothetical protein
MRIVRRVLLTATAVVAGFIATVALFAMISGHESPFRYFMF